MAWAFQLRPVAGELLTSYLARVAHGHGAAVGPFFRFHLGDSWYFTRDVDRGVATNKHELLARLSGLQISNIQSLTLRSWMQALTPASYSRNGDPAVVPWINAVGIDQAKRRHRAMAYCPECLQQGVALKRWRLSFHVWCPLHNRSLRDACGRCSAVFIPHLSRRSVAFCYSCSAVLSRASVNDDEFRYASVAGLQAQMGYWLEQACEGDVEARDRLHGLRILASLRTSALVGSAGRDPQGEHYCSAHLTGRLELLPLSERCRAMVWLSNLMAGWPASFHQLASDVGLSQRSFVRSGLEVMASSWLAGEVRCLPQGSARCRKKVALNASSRLARRSSNWRAVRAEILMKKVLSRGN